MAVYRLSLKAEQDLATMYRRGIETFGLTQAKKYFTQLHERFELLSGNVNLGRAATELNLIGLRVFRFQSHSIYYLPSEEGILILRVLDQRMSAERHI